MQPSPPSTFRAWHGSQKKFYTLGKIPLYCLLQGNYSFLSLQLCLFYLLQINKIIQFVVLCDQLLSINVLLSRFTPVVARISTAFFYMLNNIPLHVCTIVCLSISLQAFFSYFLAIMNNTVMNIYLQDFVQIYIFVSLVQIPGSRNILL